MGGRGSGLGVKTPTVNRFSATNVSDMRKELKGLSMNLTNLSDKEVELTYEAVKRFYNLDPMLVDVLEAANITIKEDPTLKPGTMAAANAYEHALKLNPKYFSGDAHKAKNAAIDSSLSGFHPRGDASSTIAHEFGHYMHYGIVAHAIGLQQAGLGNTFSNKFATSGDLRGTKASEELVASAHRTYMKNAGISSSLYMFQKHISTYATYSAKETTAEAFADVVTNGKNAKNSSQAVVQTYINTYRRLNKMWKH